jgi:hypothetical protein
LLSVTGDLWASSLVFGDSEPLLLDIKLFGTNLVGDVNVSVVGFVNELHHISVVEVKWERSIEE